MSVATLVRGKDVSKLRGQELIDFVKRHEIPIDPEDSEYQALAPVIRRELTDAEGHADPVSGYGCGAMYSAAIALTHLLPEEEGERERALIEEHFQI